MFAMKRQRRKWMSCRNQSESRREREKHVIRDAITHSVLSNPEEYGVPEMDRQRVQGTVLKMQKETERQKKKTEKA